MIRAMSPVRKFLLQLRDIGRGLDSDVSLESSARRAGQSRFRFHRLFRSLAGETLKQYTLRLRIERAAGELIATDRAISAIALMSGFASHEVFTRAFRRHFDLSPREYRLRAVANASKVERNRQRQLVNAAGPCIRLFHFQTDPVPRSKVMPLLSVERKEVAPMPFLFVRRQASASEIPATLADCFGIVFGHAMKAGLPLAGFPLARYPVVGPLMTIEAGVPLLKPAEPVGELEYCELPGGPVVFAVHGGPYDRLGDTHAATLRWIQERKLRVAGPHWEWYVTDPAEHPDPGDWRTHVYYPLSE
jgi:AraC family transcriptional regulator